MSATSIATIAVGAWAAAVSTIVGYRATKKEKELLRVETSWWTTGTWREPQAAQAALVVRAANHSRSAATVTGVDLVTDDGRTMSPRVSVVEQAERRSDALPARIESGDDAEFAYLYKSLFRHARRVRVTSARGKTYEVELNEHWWVIPEGMLNLDVVADKIGAKPGSTADSNAVEILRRQHDLPDEVIAQALRWIVNDASATEPHGVAESNSEQPRSIEQIDHDFVPHAISQDTSEIVHHGFQTVTRPQVPPLEGELIDEAIRHAAPIRRPRLRRHWKKSIREGRSA
jgi:hypothetical protein